MADNGDAAHAQKRSPAIFGIIDALAKLVVGVMRQHVADLRGDGAFQRLFEQRGNVQRHSFADFQRDVADKAVADDNIHGARENFTPLDVADEIERDIFRRL